MEKTSINLKPVIKNNESPARFCLGSTSNEFDSDDLKEVSFKGNVYDFSVDYYPIDKFNIFNIHKYLMIKTSIQNVWNY